MKFVVHRNTEENNYKRSGCSVKVVPGQARSQLLDLLNLPDAHLHGGLVEGVRLSDCGGRSDEVKAAANLDLVGVGRARLQLVDGVLGNSLSGYVADHLEKQI